MPGMPSQAATGDDADEANGDHAARGDQTDPRGLPLPRPAVRRSPADLPQRRGGCLGAVRDDLWAGCRLAGGTAASLAASDCGWDPPRTAGATGSLGSEDLAAGNPVSV